MRSLSKGILLLAACCASIILLAVPADAAETSNSEFVIIQEGDVFPEDLYAGAIRVVVNGTLDGDLIAFAAEEVVIVGEVTGSVTAAAPTVRVDGRVDGSLRVTANRLVVEGSVGEDVVAVGRVGHLLPGSDVGGEVIFWGWSLISEGRVGEDLTGTQRKLQLSGEVQGDVGVSVTSLEVVGPLVVGGDLSYRSSDDAEGLEQAEVGGAVVHQTPLPPNLRVRALGVLGRFMVVVFLTIAALTTAYGWPERTMTAVSNVGKSPLSNWLRGAVLLFSPLIAVAATAVLVGLAPATAAFPMLAILIPLILAMAGLSLAVALVAGVPAIGWLGGVAFRRLDLYGAVLTGGVMAGLAWMLPWVGWLVPLVVLPLGLGSWVTVRSSKVSIPGQVG